ncbi:CsbD family protein [Maritalea sp.]|uniref:CsbD family protein n=1 Tax=Maritalea sp. TaxID=2003361 RepID=UPI003EF27C92
MNWDIIEGKWKQLQGQAKTKWGELTDDDLDKAAGKKDILAGRIQERYGKTKEEAEREVDEWSKSIDD